MPDNENGQIPVEETTTPMPSETKPEVENPLPDEVSERTREQFEKLKETNKELAQKLELLEKVNQPPKVSALERLRPNQPVVTPTAPVEEPETDEPLTDENGYLDEAHLKKGLDDSKRRAKEAEEKARKAQESAEAAMRRIEEYEVTSEKKRVHSAFPEIDPYSAQFNPDLYDQVSKDMLWNMVNVGKEDFFGTTEKVVNQFRLKNGEAEKLSQDRQVLAEKTKQEVQEPSRSGSVSLSRKEELMNEIQRPKQAGMDALTELMRDY
jgi:hypothetical protein